jgi:hypothetical protein
MKIRSQDRKLARFGLFNLPNDALDGCSTISTRLP